MSEGTEKTLFFIKSPIANITAIESFLKKRGFNVVSESDLKIAIIEIMKKAPDYILIAWDHPSDRIPNLPKLILQSVMTTIIAYCSSNDKMQIRKLQGSGQSLKLFPPMSGPAIQRLISRLEKEKESTILTGDQANKKMDSQQNSSSSNMIQVKSGKNEDLDKFINDLPENSDSAAEKTSQIFLDKGRRSAELRSFQRGNKNKSLSIHPQDGSSSLNQNQNLQTPEQIQSELARLNQQDQANHNDIFLDANQAVNSASKTLPIVPLSEKAKNQLNLKFDEQVKIPIEEMIETLSAIAQDQQSQNQDPHNESDPSLGTSPKDDPNSLESLNQQFAQLKNETLDKTKNGFCIVVEHSTWSGYLILASEQGLDPISLEVLLTNWITENLETDNETSAQLILNCFEVRLFDVAFEKFSTETADYTKSLLINDKKTILSFFSVAPESLSLKLHDQHDMFEILTTEIPLSIPLPFDIQLYLPENKKFILYNKPNAIFATNQLERMREKRVDKLYVSFEYENAIHKFRAENRIRFMIEKFKVEQRKKSS